MSNFQGIYKVTCKVFMKYYSRYLFSIIRVTYICIAIFKEFINIINGIFTVIVKVFIHKWCSQIYIQSYLRYLYIQTYSWYLCSNIQGIHKIIFKIFIQ
jgi:hypothetical protein